ncbi:MAG: MBL fold metallo-hydrolase [Acidobacteria bacterium]|nr:MBL fold metallo-hydrolase [Acidobacteriota bacterium]
MKRLCGVPLACVLLFTAGLAMAQQDFTNVQIRASRVKGNIYMLNGTGGNVGVSIGSDGILIVDDKFAPLADKIRAALKEVGGGKLKFILNTHFHGDHTGGNPVFGPEAPIIAHANVRKRLSTEQTRGGQTTPATPKEGWPVITFDHSVSVHFNGEEIKALHFPHGHTDGDSVIFFTGSNVVHMGDDFFAGRFPFVDLDSGGDVEGLQKNIAEVIRQLPADVTLIPGHGPISKLDDLKAYHRMLAETTDLVRQRVAAGKSFDQIKQEGLPEQWNSWGGGFISTERWIETIHRSLSRQAAK